MADDEVAFWRGFIAWWMRERAAPVPTRAREALARAEQRQRVLFAASSPGDNERAEVAMRPVRRTNAATGSKRQQH